MDIELTSPTNTQMDIEPSSSSFEFAANTLLDLSASSSSLSATPRSNQKKRKFTTHGLVKSAPRCTQSLPLIIFSHSMNISIVFSLALLNPVKPFRCCTCVEAVDKKRKHGRAYNDCHQYNELLHTTTINRFLISCHT